MDHAPGIPIDASTLIYLAKADALKDAFGIVGPLAVPPAVWMETVEAGERKGAAEAAVLRVASDRGLLVRIPLDRSASRRATTLARVHRIGRGESQVMAAAEPGGWVLMDDGRASRVAAALGYGPISTVYLPVLGYRLARISARAAQELLIRLTQVVAVRAGVLVRLQAAISEERT